MTTLGVISDTHGLLRPEAIAALEGVEGILHAGDVGQAEILDRLQGIAPVEAVRGNVDPVTLGLPERRLIEVLGQRILILHILQELDLDPVAERLDIVVYGHSHQPEIREQDGVMYLNPGSAGPRRFRLPVTLARLEIGDGERRAEIVDLLSA